MIPGSAKKRMAPKAGDGADARPWETFSETVGDGSRGLISEDLWNAFPAHEGVSAFFECTACEAVFEWDYVHYQCSGRSNGPPEASDVHHCHGPAKPPREFEPAPDAPEAASVDGGAPADTSDHDAPAKEAPARRRTGKRGKEVAAAGAGTRDDGEDGAGCGGESGDDRVKAGSASRAHKGLAVSLASLMYYLRHVPDVSEVCTVDDKERAEAIHILVAVMDADGNVPAACTTSWTQARRMLTKASISVKDARLCLAVLGGMAAFLGVQGEERDGDGPAASPLARATKGGTGSGGGGVGVAALRAGPFSMTEAEEGTVMVRPDTDSLYVRLPISQDGEGTPLGNPPRGGGKAGRQTVRLHHPSPAPWSLVGVRPLPLYHQRHIHRCWQLLHHSACAHWHAGHNCGPDVQRLPARVHGSGGHQQRPPGHGPGVSDQYRRLRSRQSVRGQGHPLLRPPRGRTAALRIIEGRDPSATTATVAMAWPVAAKLYNDSMATCLGARLRSVVAGSEGYDAALTAVRSATPSPGSGVPKFADIFCKAVQDAQAKVDTAERVQAALREERAERSARAGGNGKTTTRFDRLAHAREESEPRRGSGTYPRARGDDGRAYAGAGRATPTGM